MKEFLSKRLKQFKNLLSTKKFKIRKIRSIAIVLIATITFTTLGSNFVYAKNNEVYERNLIAANNDPSVIEAIQNNREVYNSSKIDKFVVADNYMTYATILGKNGAVFFDGTDHLNEAGQCKDGCKAMIATATFIRGTKPGTEEAKYCISYYIACLNCSRNKAQQIGLESYTNPSEKERLSNNSKELKGLFNGMDKYFAEHPEESPIPKINVPKDVINKIKSNRKFVLDNGIFVKENGQNVTANASVEDAIDVNENGICNSGNHRRTYDHYTHKGADLLVRHGCFDCLYESFKVVPKSEYDTLEKRIKLANDSVRIKQFFIDNGLSFEQEKQSFKPNGESIQKGREVWNIIILDINLKWYNVSYHSNNVVSILTEINGNEKVYCNLLYDIVTKRIQVKVFEDGITEYDVNFTNDAKLILVNRKTGETHKFEKKDKKGNFQELTMTSISIIAGVVIGMCAVLKKIDTAALGASLSSLSAQMEFLLDMEYLSSLNSNAQAVEINSLSTFENTIKIELRKELEEVKKKGGNIRDVKIYWTVACKNEITQSEYEEKKFKLHLPKPITFDQAVDRVSDGKYVFTPYEKPAEILARAGAIAAKTKNPNKEFIVSKDPPHSDRISNTLIELREQNMLITKEQKYQKALEIDNLFTDANSKLQFAHYHITVNKKKRRMNDVNSHIFYFSTGKPEDMEPAMKGIYNEYKDILEGAFEKF